MRSSSPILLWSSLVAALQRRGQPFAILFCLIGRLTAVHLLMINIVAFAIGSVAVALWPNDATALGQGLSLLVATTVSTSVFLFYLSRREIAVKLVSAVPRAPSPNGVALG